MKETPFTSCPKCGANFAEARQLLKEETLAFCLRCKFPLVLIAGKYRLEKEMAQGGYGVVYKARHIYLEQDALRVVKILKEEVFQIPGMEARFYREVQVTSALSQKDEHIIRIYDDFGKNANIGPFYVMEYLEGLRLDALLVQSTHLPVLSFVMHIFRQLCHSIQHAHDAGIVHRDLKPENLYLVERRGDPYFLKIIDFGIAKPMNQEELKMTQGVLGSPFYMAPEQCLNQPVDARADIYAMGCILFELLTGFPPFHPKFGNTSAASLVELLGAHVALPPPAPRELRPERVSEAMQRVLLCALEKNPNKRYQSARDMLDAVELAYDPMHIVKHADAENRELVHAGLSQLPMEQMERVGEVRPHTPRPSAPTADFPGLGGVSPQFAFPESHIQIGGDMEDTPWDELAELDANQTVVRAFFRTVQNTIRDEEGIRYYRAIFVLALFLMGGIAIGWWVFFFTHGGRPSVVDRRAGAALSHGTQRDIRPVPRKRVVRSTPRSPAPRASADAGPSRARVRPRTAPPAIPVVVRGRAAPSAKRVRRRRRYRKRRARIVRRRAVARRKATVRRKAAPRVVRVAARPQPRRRRPAPPIRRNPTTGCPAASDGVRWVRLDIRPLHIAATTRIIQGVGQSYRRSFGVCLALRSAVQLRIDANEFRPCILKLTHRHARLAIRMKKDRMDSIETDHQYCIR